MTDSAVEPHTHIGVVQPQKVQVADEPLRVSAYLMTHYDRNGLYEEVWEAPLKKVAKRLGMGESSLGQVCRRLYIPLPGPGYWNKKMAGKPVGERPPLPAVQIVPTTTIRTLPSAGTLLVVSGRLMDRYNRSELYEDVWRLPLSRLAAKWGICDSALGHVCKRLFIPLPGVGYWNKKAAGKPLPPRPPLPPVQISPRYLNRKRLSQANQVPVQQGSDESDFPNPAVSERIFSADEVQAPESDNRNGEVPDPSQNQIVIGNEPKAVPLDGPPSNSCDWPKVGGDQTKADIRLGPTEAFNCGQREEISPAPCSDRPDGLLEGQSRSMSDLQATHSAEQISRSGCLNKEPSELDQLARPDANRVLLVPRSLATRYSREQLYQEVWSIPMRILCKTYAISDVALAKTCKRLHVPVPGRGYWAKLAANAPVPGRPPLPDVEVVETPFPKRKGRIHSPAEIDTLLLQIQGAAEKGIRLRDACRDAGIDPLTYRRWRRKIEA